MKQFRVTGIDNRTNKPLQAMIDAADEADAYKMARRQFATIDRIDRIVSAPVAGGGTPGVGVGGAAGADEDTPTDLDEDEEDDDPLPDLSSFDLEAPRVSGGIKGLLRRYLGHRIGIATDGQDKLRVAKLLAVRDDVFTLRLEGAQLVFHLPLRTIMALLETAPTNPAPTANGQTPGLIVELPRLAVLRTVPDKPTKS